MSVRRRGRASVAGGAGALLLATAAAIGVSLTAFAAELGVNGNGKAGSGATMLETALIEAYQNNPQLNAQRAATRAVDEAVPTALSGYRPRVTGTTSLTEQYLDTTTRSPPLGTTITSPPTALPSFPTYTRNFGNVAVSSAGLTATQTLLNGFQTANRTRQAEGQVFAARETLRTTEQTVLLNAATAYMNLLQTAALLELQRSNVNVLEVPAPARLAAATPVDRLSPRTLAGAIERGRIEHPTITTAQYNVDVAVHQVKIAEGALAPVLSAVGSVQKSYGSTNSLAVLESLSASLQAQLSVPIYQGGVEYAAIRQAKETLGQRRLDLDTARDQVQSTVTQAWGQLEAAKAQITATQAQVAASEIALNGVRGEARVGQRTTLDVLNAQQALVNARSALVTAQRDRVVASYSVLAAVGSLSPQILGLGIQVYDPMVHYQQVRDAWGGVRVPDGR